MKDLIKRIREIEGLSQSEYAETLGVSFSTVNRWENGKAYPNQLAQIRLYEQAKQHNVQVTELVMEKIQNIVKGISMSPQRILLYHGSKSGIKGDIAPVSRVHCDFGRGFYMGTIPEQPLTLICGFEESHFYVMSVDVSNLSVLSVEADLEWAMLVAWHRGKMESVKGTTFYDQYAKMTANVDVVKGPIADDRMFYVLDNFFEGNITDQALISSLSALRLGEQYVAITPKACSRIQIEQEIPLSFFEKKALQEKAEENRIQGVSMANVICRKYRREGVFFDEILDRAKRGE